jgi:hypothetical protein
MDTKKLKDAIEVAKSEIFTLSQYLKDKEMNTLHGQRFNKMIALLTTFTQLAELYQKAEGCFPAKKEKTADRQLHTWEGKVKHIKYYDSERDIGYNQAIEDCRTALVRKLGGIERLIHNYITSEILISEKDNVSLRLCHARLIDNKQWLAEDIKNHILEE